MATKSDLQQAGKKLAEQQRKIKRALKGEEKTVASHIENMKSLPQGAVAWLFGVSPRTIRDRQEAPRNSDGTYNAQAVVSWHLEQLKPIDGDSMLSGGDSPALERFRNARADREELELAARREHLVDVDDFWTWYDAEVSGPLMKNLERLQRKFGAEALEIMEAGMRQAGEAITQRFEK